MSGTILHFAQLRRSEWICVAYFGYVTVLSFFIKISPGRRYRILLINLAVATGLLLLPGAATFTSRVFLSVVRDWLPAPLIFWGYHEAGRLTVLGSDRFFEKTFVHWDDVLLKSQWLGFLSPESRTPVWLESLLEFSYLQCYVVVPSGIATLYFAHLGRFADAYWSVVLPAVFLAFGLTPLFPAQPPRKLAEGAFAPRQESALRKLNLWILNHASIKVNTFPSGHVAGAVSASLALMRIEPAAGICYLLVAAGIVLGSVRGRYHYSLDAVAGAVVAVAAYIGCMPI